MVGKMIVGACALAALFAGAARATVIVDFHSDGAIQDGDVYDVVNIWNNANVVMTGGLVEQVYTHDFSSFSLSGGEIASGMKGLDSSRLYVVGGTSNRIWLDCLDSSVLVMKGGIEQGSIFAGDFATVDIHGYDLVVTPLGRDMGVQGYWINQQRFWIELRGGAGTYSKTDLHTIPEPATFGLLAFGVVFLKPRARNRHRLPGQVTFPR